MSILIKCVKLLLFLFCNNWSNGQHILKQTHAHERRDYGDPNLNNIFNKLLVF